MFLAELTELRSDLVQHARIFARISEAPLLMVAQGILVFGASTAPGADKQRHGK